MSIDPIHPQVDPQTPWLKVSTSDDFLTETLTRAQCDLLASAVSTYATVQAQNMTPDSRSELILCRQVVEKFVRLNKHERDRRAQRN